MQFYNQQTRGFVSSTQTDIIKAITTEWNGYRFRSRLEARWSVFFDYAGFNYEYEPEGFELGDCFYLPDFWIDSLNLWVEIKREEPCHSERSKAFKLAKLLKDNVAIIWGQPWQLSAEEWETRKYPDKWKYYNAEIFIGNISKILLQQDHLKWIWVDTWPEALTEYLTLYGFDAWKCWNDPDCLIKLDKLNYKLRHDESHPKWIYGIREGDCTFIQREKSIYLDAIINNPYSANQNKLNYAFEKARGARFEHGEKP